MRKAQFWNVEFAAGLYPHIVHSHFKVEATTGEKAIRLAEKLLQNEKPRETKGELAGLSKGGIAWVEEPHGEVTVEARDK